MKLVPQTSPYIRKDVSVKRMMLDVIIALMPVTLFAMIVNGWSGIYVFLISIGVMLATELIAHGLMHWPKDMKFKELFSKEGFSKLKAGYTINNITAPLISALIFALIVPAGLDWYVVFVGALFGMLIGKMVFGGLGSNIFNPAAVGRIFIGICFGDRIGAAYQSSRYWIDGTTTATPLGMVKTAEGLNLANTGAYSLGDLFLGQTAGSMGEVSILLILVGAIYLFARRSADLRSCLSMLLSFAALMFVACLSFVIKFGGNVWEIWAYQLFSGGLFFGCVFMITDPVTSPTSKFGRVAFGALAGVITCLVRICGAYPEGVAFSILIANMIAPCIDYFMRGKPNTYTKKQCIILGVALIVVACILSATVVGGWF